MNSSIRYKPNSLEDHAAFIELVLGIIDSKLQYISRQTEELIQSYDISFPEANAKQPSFLAEHYPHIASEVPLHEDDFAHIEKHSKYTSLLFTMRIEIGQHNVSRIYDLLSNDQYTLFNQEELQSLIRTREDALPAKS